jgi:diguanylate cyclase (GGDEF)-like protein/PAS domain S-box-containing protein
MTRLTIRSRLLWGFLLITVLPLAGVGVFYGNVFERSLTATVLQNIASIADKKADQIDSFINERLVDVQTYSRSERVANGLHHLARAFAGGGVAASDKMYTTYRPELVSLLESGLYYDLLLMDMQGNVVFSVIHEADYGSNLNTGPFRESGLADGYHHALDTLNTELTPFRPYAPSKGKIASFYVAPVFYNNQLSGAIALQINLEVFARVVADNTGLGLTGETVLAQQQGDEVLIMTPLRHVADAAFLYRIPIQTGSASLPIFSAVQGGHEQAIYTDYIGHEVAAAIRYLPALGWGMTVKVDTDEALAQVREVRQVIWVFLGVILIIAAAVATLIGRSLSHPIDTLVDATTAMAKGEGAQTISESGGPELQRLASTFNQMFEQVTAAKSGLEQEVAARTCELVELSTLQGAILDNAAYAVIATTIDGVMTVYNRAAERLLGYSADEMVGRQTPAVFHLPAEVVARADEFGRELGIPLEPGFEVFVVRARQGLPNEYEWTYVHKDGHQFPVLLSVTALIDSGGEISGYLGIAIDISQRKQAEASLLESREQLNEAQRLAKVGSWTLDLRSNHLHWSDEIFNLFEIDKAQFAASYEAFLAAIHPDDREMVNRAYTESLQNRLPYEITHRLMFADGRIKYVYETCETLFDEQGKPFLSRGTVQDVSEQHQAEETINLYANVFRYSAEAILISDSENRIVATNPALTALTGYTQAELVGRNPHVLASGLTPEATYQEMWQALEESGHWQGELFDRRKDGAIYPKWISVSVIRDSEGRVKNHIATFVDITARKAAEKHIYQLAHHDPLTGLYNRFSLEERLGQALMQVQRESGKLALMFIDMDRFKVINDTLGHNVGDMLLVEIAKRLQAAVRDSDIVARIGGDEFVVVLTGIDESLAAMTVAAKMVISLGAPYEIGEHLLHSTPSVGISLFPEDSRDAEGLMKSADTAMYHAKAQGRNNYQFFTKELNAAAQERFALERDLRVALERGQYEVYYQPKIETCGGRVSGVEALIRWNHPQKGLIPPDRFIPIAEETGLIEAIGLWVLDEACRQLALWRGQGFASLKMAVNLSPRQLRDPNLVGELQQILTKHHIIDGELELEVTETSAMANAEQAIEQMHAIRATGVELAIDDFGTGYSSLAYLKLFPIQTLKLDRTFVRDIEVDENDAAICMATIALAHTLGLKVVAEGVETEAQRAFLASYDCDSLQGYLFSRPLPAAEITEYLKTHRQSC